jgi:hypothetical protein
MWNGENAVKCINYCTDFFTADFHLTENIFQQIWILCIMVACEEYIFLPVHHCSLGQAEFLPLT